tara:strand:- start:72 stop:203 length:132 start_codon:yes stop_codon:yes gene_type:complete
MKEQEIDLIKSSKVAYDAPKEMEVGILQPSFSLVIEILELGMK